MEKYFSATRYLRRDKRSSESRGQNYFWTTAINLAKNSNWIAEEFLRLAERISSKLERGQKVDRDEVEKLQLLVKLELTKKKKH